MSSSNEPPDPPKSSKSKWQPGKTTRAQDNKKARQQVLSKDSSSRSGGIERPQTGEPDRAARAAARSERQDRLQAQSAGPPVGSVGLEAQPGGQLGIVGESVAGPARQPSSSGVIDRRSPSGSKSRGEGAPAVPLRMSATPEPRSAKDGVHGRVESSGRGDAEDSGGNASLEDRSSTPSAGLRAPTSEWVSPPRRWNTE